MNHSELIETRANTPSPKPPSLTSAKISEAEEMRKQVEAFIAKGKNYTVIGGNTESRAMTAKEQMAACYDKAIEDGRKMDKPLNPKKR
tara:strand:+ start:9755 stop:10018 length:264 start_codon:yes stop_codon:yes gene_type:complete